VALQRPAQPDRQTPGVQLRALWRRLSHERALGGMVTAGNQQGRSWRLRAARLRLA